MAFNRLYTADGSYENNPSELMFKQGPEANPTSAPETGVPTAPTAPPTPSADPAPGPNRNPSNAGGTASPPTPPPPAIASSVPGVVGSEATGGVQGSFGQAGTSDFSKRFGLPAAWFGGGPASGLAREAGNQGRGVLGREGAGTGAGSYGAQTTQNLAAPSAGMEGGGKNDEEFQRVLREVMANRFGRA